MHYRLLNSQSGLAIGDYPTLEAAWEAVKQNKGRMILWKQWEITGGWIWEQQPLRYYSPKEKLIFKAKTYWKRVQEQWTKIRKTFRR